MSVCLCVCVPVCLCVCVSVFVRARVCVIVWAERPVRFTCRRKPTGELFLEDPCIALQCRSTSNALADLSSLRQPVAPFLRRQPARARTDALNTRETVCNILLFEYMNHSLSPKSHTYMSNHSLSHTNMRLKRERKRIVY